jgi:pSer/pThr/pTyr-binding forkhead associated (FHA) protein
VSLAIIEGLPSAMASTARLTNPEEIVFTLTARAPGPHFNQPERRLTLTRQKPLISIGRASKVPAKGFTAAVNNAWFESPVMSRSHAEIFADFDANPKAVFVRDAGSLHGTYRRGCRGTEAEVRLEQDQQVQLESGDVLRFGIDIFRSKETFPPCSVDYVVEDRMDSQLNDSTPMDVEDSTSDQAITSARSFSVPDDVDDDSSVVHSDIDSVVEADITIRETRQQIHSASTDDLQAGNTIDLTKGTTDLHDCLSFPSDISLPGDGDAELIDLTSEPERVVNDKTGQKPSQSIPQDEVIMETTVGHSLSAKEQAQRERDAFGFETYFIEDDSSIDYDMRASPDEFSVDSESDVDSDISNESVNESGDDEVLDERTSTSDIDLDDDEDIDGHIMDNDEIACNEGEKNEVTPMLVSRSSPPITPNTKHTVTQHTARDDLHTEVPSQDFNLKQATFFPPPPSQNQARQPSPSDAALVKCHTPLSRSTTTKTTAELLGAKTGKFDFFSAREENRATVMGRPPRDVSSSPDPLEPYKWSQAKIRDFYHRSIPPPPASPPAKIGLANESATTDHHESPSSKGCTSTSVQAPQNQHDVSQTDHTYDPGTQQSAWAESGDKFINSPIIAPSSLSEERTRLQSPEHDMTSAYTFQQSKKANEGRSFSNCRRRLQIQDLLLDNPIQPHSADAISNSKETSSKRSFEDAFGPGSSQDPSSHIEARPDTSDLPATMQISIPDVRSSAGDAMAGGVDVALGIDTCHRPTKKRRFAEVAACLALGGAGVLSALIMSAPTFG